MIDHPRDDRGRFVSRRCPDQNCGGLFKLEECGVWSGYWRCDGLTHLDDTSPLIACEEIIGSHMEAAAWRATADNRTSRD